MFNVFYVGRMWTLSKCYNFYHVCTTLIYNVMMLKTIILKKNRCYRPKFSFINNYSRTSLNIISYWNEKSDSLSGWTLPNLPIKVRGGHQDIPYAILNTISGTCWKVSKFIDFDLNNKNSDLPACFWALIRDFFQFIKIPWSKTKKTKF